MLFAKIGSTGEIASLDTKICQINSCHMRHSTSNDIFCQMTHMTSKMKDKSKVNNVQYANYKIATIKD